VEVPSDQRNGQDVTDALSGTRDVLRRACAKYQQLLLGPNGATGLQMLADRGIEDDAIVRFGIGYAPDSWSTLSDDRSFSREHLIAGGLAVPRREKKGCYDFFRNRIVFPVRNDTGDVIGFGGRRIGKDGPKYLNTAETELYQKGRILFGLQQARPAIRMTRSVIVCEGFFDVISPAQAGIEHIVSTCGTALTETQAEMVLSLADRVFFCFDGDSAGVKATWRAAEMLVPLASDRHEIRLCRLPAGEDPDSFVRGHGIASFQQALDASPTLSAYLIGEITRGAKIPEARAKSLSVAAALWRQFAAPGLALFFRQYACEALQISVEEFDRLAVSAPRRAGDTHVRPCPCCGLMATQISNDCGHRIECSGCGLATRPTATEAECRALWNRREKPR
jgi:DNA primase